MNKTSILFFFSLFFCQLNFAAIIYVDIDATGNNDGTSWANAYNEPQDALAASIIGDQIWVAEGLYKPINPVSEFDCFELNNGVEFYGGFNGTETMLSQRDYVNNVTILSGNIGNQGAASDNLIHVVRAHDVTSTTLMDGFTVIEGYANGVGLESEMGGGFINDGGSCTVRNCTFLDNYAEYGGGGIATYSSGILTVENCTIRANFSDAFGGGVMCRTGTLNIFNSDISGNEGSTGGGFRIYSGQLNIDKCTISGNIAGNSAGGLSIDDDGVLILTNSLVVGNLAPSRSILRMSSLSNPGYHVIKNCTFMHNKDTDLNNSIPRAMWLNDRTEMRNCIVWDNCFDNKELYSTSPDISHCIIKGGFSISGVPQPNIYDTPPTLVLPASQNQAPFNYDNYDYRLTLLSFGLDDGNSSYASDLPFDLDNNQRIHGSSVDLGAYENGYCSLNATISASGATEFCEGGMVTLTAAGGDNYLWSNGATSPQITVDASSLYEVVITSNAGCLGQVSQQVTVYDTALSISGSTSFCIGGFTTLTASGNNSSYVWSDGQEGASAIITTPGTYTVTATSNDGCSLQEEIVVTEVANPSPPIIYSNLTLTTGSFSSYQWYFNGSPIPNANIQSHVPSEVGDYYVVVMNSTGCEGTSDVYTVGAVSAVHDFEAKGIQVFPTLVEDAIQVNFTETSDYELFIVDLQGRILLEQNVLQQQNSIALEDLPTGVYVLFLRNGADVLSQTFYKLP